MTELSYCSRHICDVMKNNNGDHRCWTNDRICSFCLWKQSPKKTQVKYTLVTRWPYCHTSFFKKLFLLTKDFWSQKKNEKWMCWGNYGERNGRFLVLGLSKRLRISFIFFHDIWLSKVIYFSLSLIWGVLHRRFIYDSWTTHLKLRINYMYKSGDMKKPEILISQSSRFPHRIVHV